MGTVGEVRYFTYCEIKPFKPTSEKEAVVCTTLFLSVQFFSRLIGGDFYILCNRGDIIMLLS